MAKRLWLPQASNTELLTKTDGSLFKKVDDDARILVIDDFQALGTATRTALAEALGYADLATFDAALEAEEWEILDRLDYYSTYDTRTDNLTVADGAWFTPEAVESFCGEETGEEATLSVDGVNTTFWSHVQDHQHSIVYRLRGYPKKISKIRIRYGGSAAVERLNNMDVHASTGLANIDDAASILETGINLTWPAGPAVWVEHTLAKKSLKARYVKLVVDDTDNVNNTLQMREFAVWVETKEPGE